MVEINGKNGLSKLEHNKEENNLYYTFVSNNENIFDFKGKVEELGVSVGSNLLNIEFRDNVTDDIKRFVILMSDEEKKEVKNIISKQIINKG